MSDILPKMDKHNNFTVINENDISDKKSRLIIRDKIDALEKKMQEHFGSETGEMEEINNNGLKEHLIEGTYIRELFIPKGIAIVSRIWKKERFWIIATGEVTFTTEMGTQRVKAPFTKKVPPGSKVALYTHEDTLWFAIAGTTVTDLNDIEGDVLAEKYEDCVYPWDLIEEKI